MSNKPVRKPAKARAVPSPKPTNKSAQKPANKQPQQARRQMRDDYDEAFARLITAVDRLQALQPAGPSEHGAATEAFAHFRRAEADYRRRRNILVERMQADQAAAKPSQDE